MQKMKYFVVNLETTQQELKGQLNQLAKQYHPDLSKAPDKEVVMAEINAEYQYIIEHWDKIKNPTVDMLTTALTAMYKTLSDEKAMNEMREKALMTARVAHIFTEKMIPEKWNERINMVLEFIEKGDTAKIAKAMAGIEQMLKGEKQ